MRWLTDRKLPAGDEENRAVGLQADPRELKPEEMSGVLWAPFHDVVENIDEDVGEDDGSGE